MLQGYLYYFNNIIQIFSDRHFEGWGKKRTGRFAAWCHRRFGGTCTLYEDGFIRSLGLGTEGAPSFGTVSDDIGIYYDASVPSRLEHILNTYDFSADETLMKDARRAIRLIKKHHISKYNDAPMADERFRTAYEMTEGQKSVLVIAQTAGDASLTYGMLNSCTTEEMVEAAIAENPDAAVYLKIHPDVLNGTKKSNIDIEQFKDRCRVITENVNPVSLLEHFDKVYTKTSQMGFEALLVGCECVCFGMPFYAGWGVDKLKVKDEELSVENQNDLIKKVLNRRKKKRSLEEVFAAAYLCYTHYYNPYKKESSDIFDTIETLVALRDGRK